MGCQSSLAVAHGALYGFVPQVAGVFLTLQIIITCLARNLSKIVAAIAFVGSTTPGGSFVLRGPNNNCSPEALENILKHEKILQICMGIVSLGDRGDNWARAQEAVVTIHW